MSKVGDRAVNRFIKHLSVCSTILLLFLQSPYRAAERQDLVPPPEWPEIANHLVPTLASSPTSDVRLGELTVKFERTSLYDIQDVAGGVIQRRYWEQEGPVWLCYTVSSNQARIWFSSGVIGGPELVVLGFDAVMSDQAKSPSPSCPELPARFRQVSLGKTLWLGGNPDQLKKLFGKPSAKQDGWQFYSYLGKVRVKGSKDLFDRLAGLGVQIENGRIVALGEWQTTTN